MSRIDQAWRRASGFGKTDPLAHPPQQPDEGLLQQYPPENVVHASVERPEPSLTKAAIADVRPITLDCRGGRSLRSKTGRQRSRRPDGSSAIRQARRCTSERSTDRRLKSLLITSALPGEGKSLTAANLALTLSGSCAKRVLLIDADFRRPSVHRVFRIPNNTGLVDALQSEGSDVSLTNVTENLTS